MTDNLAIVINYCSNDRVFIDALLRECKTVQARQVIVSVGTHHFDMQPEDIRHIEDLARKHPWVRFILYPVVAMEEYENPLTSRKVAYWHNIARIQGCKQLVPEIEWVLFLDADEIPEGERFRDWYMTSRPKNIQKIYKLANYWYFRDPIFQATKFEDSVMLVPRAACCYPILMHESERDGIPLMTGLECERDVVHPITSLPMFHHYSWVRTKDAMLKKVRTWAHKDDKNWEELIEAEFMKQFDVSKDTDFVHGYSYVRVPNWFGIQL